MPKVGDSAPDFTLRYFEDGKSKDMKLSDYRGKKNLVLGFYIFSFYRRLNPANEKTCSRI